MIAPADLNRPIVSVDFDRTIHDSDTYTDVPHGKPIPGTYRALNILKNAGFDLVLYTARDNFVHVWRWLNQHDLAHYFKAVTNKKPKGHVALFDDSAVPVRRQPNGLLEAVQQWLKEAAS